MNERDPTTGAGEPVSLDDSAVGRLIQDAGRRPPIPREDLDAIATSARAAWERSRRRRIEPGSATATDARRERKPRAGSPATLLALAAVMAALMLGLLLVWRGSREGGPSVSPARVATVVSGSPMLRVETGGVERPLATGEDIVAGMVVQVGAEHSRAGAGTALLLESGTAIRLEAGSAARFEPGARIDLLTGALYADTEPGGAAGDAADRGRRSAIEVHTTAGVARDVGTRFAARLSGGARDPMLRVLVRSGAVSVEHAGTSATAGAGEQIVARGGGIDVSPAVTYGSEWEWILDAAPPFDLTGKSIAEVLDWVARETGWTVRYEEPGLERAARTMVLQASGSQGAMLRADQAPAALLPSANLSGDLDEGVLTVRRR